MAGEGWAGRGHAVVVSWRRAPLRDSVSCCRQTRRPVSGNIGTAIRYVGLFLEAPLAVPWLVVKQLAAQLGLKDPSAVRRYTERRRTLYDHAWEIRHAYGYHPYEDAEWGRRFRTFLHGRGRTPRARGAVRPRGGMAAPLPGAVAGGERAGPAGVGGAESRGQAAARHRRGRRPPSGTTGTAFARALE
ncbi:DUF4158 domain-containing protein [Streptomyces rimosus]|nr:DUF4158 domain-containing protein [Streptomyces rimosus]